MAHDKRNTADTDFEGTLKSLQKLVGTLEKGDAPLDELVAKFTEGHALLNRCQEQLKAARLRVEQLRAQDALPAPMDDPDAPQA